MKRIFAFLMLVSIASIFSLPFVLKDKKDAKDNQMNFKYKYFERKEYEEEPVAITREEELLMLGEDLYKLAANEFNTKMNEIEIIQDMQQWFIEYKKLIEAYEDTIDMPESIYDCFSEDEIYLIQRMVETETYQAPFDAKVNVANVALNRLESGRYGDSLKEIITKPSQFAYHRKKISEDTILAVEYAFQIQDTTDGALSFHSNSKTNTFNRQKYIFTDSVGHHFYK